MILIGRVFLIIIIICFFIICFRDSLLVPIINCSTSIYAGFAVFSVLGYLAEAKGVPVSLVAEGGMCYTEEI